MKRETAAIPGFLVLATQSSSGRIRPGCRPPTVLNEVVLDQQQVTEKFEQRSISDALGKNTPGKASRSVIMAGARAAMGSGVHKGQRSRIGNGKALLPGVSGNSAWARRMRDLMSDHIADLGGQENTSSAERNLVRRAAALTIQAELLEQQFALASAVDADTVDIYGRIVGHLRRTLETIGLQRRSRVVGSSLGDLMRTTHEPVAVAVEIDAVAAPPAFDSGAAFAAPAPEKTAK
jgi:hypothetical protein